MAKASKNEVAIPEQNAGIMVMDEVPEYLRGSQGRGSEEVTSNDITIPRLEIVQSQSPIKDENPEAREGMLFNSATQELYGDSVYFIPVYFRVEYLVWKDQNEGGGFFGSFPTEGEAKARLREVVADGEDEEFMEVVDTPVHFGLLVTPDGKAQQIVVSMAKSKAKVSRKWNSMIQIVGGDRFSRVYRIGTFTDENKNKQKFKNFTIAPAGFPTEALYREAEKTYEVFRSGEVKAAHDTVVNNGDDRPVGSDRGDI